MTEFIPLNAFSNITVQGLVLRNRESVEQTFHRGVVVPGEHVQIGFEKLTRPDGIPPRPKSRLPPPGDIHLQVSSGEKLGAGRVGGVRIVNVLEPSMNNKLPPLVMKISHHKRSVNMAREAWFYEELEQLQGISVPRCYGFFQTRLEDGDTISTWDPYADELHDWEISEQENYEKDVPGQGKLLSILLLEKLGSLMPIGQPIKDIIKDVYEVYNDLAHFGIESLDIRYDNILSVGDGSQMVCPIHGHAHNWRVLDFDYARKTDGNLYFTDGCNHSWLERMFDSLVVGRIVENWT